MILLQFLREMKKKEKQMPHVDATQRCFAHFPIIRGRFYRYFRTSRVNKEWKYNLQQIEMRVKSRRISLKAISFQI